MKRAAILLTALAAFAAAAHAWTGPDPARTPAARGDGAANLDFALTEICMPFILQNAEEPALTNRAGVYPNDLAPESFGQSGMRAYAIGRAGKVSAGVAANDDKRECLVVAEEGDAQVYLDALEHRLTDWPTHLAPTQPIASSATFANRITLCAPSSGPFDVGLISAAPPNARRGQPSLVLILRRNQRLSAPCAPQ